MADNLKESAKHVTVGAEGLVLTLINRINRFRPLLDDELSLAASIVAKQCRREAAQTYHAWTPEQNDELWNVARKSGGATAFARKHGIGEKAVRDKLRRMRIALKTGQAMKVRG